MENGPAVNGCNHDVRVQAEEGLACLCVSSQHVVAGFPHWSISTELNSSAAERALLFIMLCKVWSERLLKSEQVPVGIFVFLLVGSVLI